MSSVALRTALFGPRPDGSILNLNFAQGGYSYLGGNTSLSSLPIWSYSGSVSGTGATFRTALNSSSTVINFTNGIPRITDLGLLIEEARTNSVKNSTMVGASAGTPGVLPTGWSVTAAGTWGAITPTQINVGSQAGGGNPIDGYVGRLVLYPVGLSDAQLQALTQ